MDLPSLHALFEPASVAVIGASNDENKVGGRPIAFLRKAGYAGRVLPINPGVARVQGLEAFASLAEAGPVEHAIVAVAARDVLAAARQCAAQGVRVLQVFSAGFADAGQGAAQEELLAVVREAGMRLVGPNSLGLFNAANGFFGTFATALDGAWPECDPVGGNVGLASQSGAFGSYCYGLAQARGLKFSKFVATGNEADVDVAECIAYLAQDPATQLILACFEGCRDGARLVEALRLAHAAGKPVLVMKTGSSEAGAQAAATHTGSLAGQDAVFDGVFRQFGAWRAPSLDALVDTAYALAIGARRGDMRARPAPLAHGLGVVSTSGGVGVLVADRASESGLALPSLGADARQALAGQLPSATAANPFDTSTAVLGHMGAIADAMELVLEGTGAEAMLGFLAHVGRNERHWASLREPLFALVERRPQTRFVLSMLAPPEVRTELEAQGIALFEDPVRAVAAIAAVAQIARSLARPLPAGASRRAAAAPAAPGRTLDEASSKQWLRRAGLALPAERVAATRAEAETAVRALEAASYAFKIVSPDITHKTEVGGVMLDVPPDNAGAAWDALMQAVRERAGHARLDGVLVTPMAAGGIDAILGAVRDPVFGPVLVFGLGGTWVEVFRDVVFRAAPVDEDEALRMIGQTRVAPLLAGVRGAAATDTRALASQIAAFSEFVAAHAGEIESIEINPWRLRPEGALALDAVVVQAAAASHGADDECC